MKKYWFFGIFFFLLIIPILNLFHPGLPLTHDSQDHVARIANFYENLKQGNLIPRWAGNLNWGYGHPILEFLYPLPSYLASLFHFLGFSLIDSTKIVYGLGMFLSGITMFLWLSSFWGKKAAFIGGLIYVFTPYRFVELYVRGDIGENLAFVFIPLVLLFIHKLSIKTKTSSILAGSISLAFLILSHNAISLMFLPFILIYGCYKLKFYAKNKKEFLVAFFLIFIFGFGLSSFFWVPAFFEGKFTLRNIVTAGEYKSRFVTFSQLLYGPWSYGGSGEFTVQLGILNWIMLITSILLIPLFWIRKNKKLPFNILLILFSIVGIFLMLKESNIIWSKFIILQNFQFPWRFLAILVFTTSALSALVIEQTPKKISLFFSIAVVTCALILNMNFWHPKGYLYKQESFFTGIYHGTTDTGESAPIWSIRFMEHRPKSLIEVISGSAKILVQKRSVTLHKYTVIAKTDSRVVENTLYFPGWEIKVDGKKVPIEFQDENYRGLMTFAISQGNHSVEILFRENALRLISDMISLVSLCIMLGIFVLAIRKK